MSKKPELVVAPKDILELKDLANAGADAFIVGDARFALVPRGSFDEKLLAEAIHCGKDLNKKIYLQMDAIFTNDILLQLDAFLAQIAHLNFDGIRVADLGAYWLVKEKLPNRPIHLVDGMMLTNHETVNYWANKGIKRMRLAHELTMDEVLEIKQNATAEIEVLIQGVPLMFTSRRKLLDNYLEFQRQLGKDVTLSVDKNFLFDQERHLYYPMIQNDHGTHIYGGSDVCMIDDLRGMIDKEIDGIYIESATYGTDELIKIIHFYEMAIDLAIEAPDKYEKVGLGLYREIEKLKQANMMMDRGFYYKPTIYKNQTK